jgi:hypothetical protein
MARAYKLISGSAVDKFHQSRAKVRMYAGGFANGKTTGISIEALKILKQYPGVSALFARNTFANLERTLGREFFNWCPASWIKSGTLRSGSVRLVNGSTVDFSHLSQNTGSDGTGSSNLLSANYGLIVVDQIEDPDITEKDFDDMLGRLRQQVERADDDATMPASGPRMMLLAANPSLGWVYHKLVKPYHDFLAGRFNSDLLCERDPTTTLPVLDETGKPIPLIEIFEASTYDNAQNLPADYIAALEAKYTGKMRDRYLLGKWVAFDGVVYQDYDASVHRVSDRHLQAHLSSLRDSGEQFNVVEAYDLGLTVPSCYLYALVDSAQNVYITDGFYKAPFDLQEQVRAMSEIRGAHNTDEINADPAIFRKNSVVNGVPIAPAQLFAEKGIRMRRAPNERMSGIVNVMQYLRMQKTVVNPFTGELGAPKLYFSDKLSFLHDEFNTYRWRKDRNDASTDTTVDKDDHAMDTLRYMLGGQVSPGRRTSKLLTRVPAAAFRWHEQSDDSLPDPRMHRYRT